MSRRKPQKPSLRTLPNRSHVLRAVEELFTQDEQDRVLAELERVTPLQDASLEYLQLEIVAMSRGREDCLNELVETARENVMDVHDRFLVDRPYCGWPEARRGTDTASCPPSDPLRKLGTR